MEESKKIKAFLSKHIRQVELQDDQDIFALGFVNSLFAMQLVLFIEQEFGISIANEDLDIGNFRTVQAIVLLVQRSLTRAI